jgi:NADH-ubiquinone oxidoreductase chain 5
VAAITKSAQIPFSAWLPAAMAAPTPVSALVHSSTLVTAGVYLMIRFSLGLPNKELLLGVGIVTMFIARLSALMETDIKKVVALSTLRQLGLIFTAIGTGFYEYRFFHLLIHAYFKAVMFISVGNCIHIRNDYQDLRFLRLRAKPYAVSFTVCFVSNASLMGLPFLAGFYSKDLIIETLADSRCSAFMTFLIILSVLFTALYSLRFIVIVFFFTILFVAAVDEFTFQGDLVTFF